MRQAAEEIRDEIIANRRALHAIPEVGSHLPKTAAYLTARLSEMGYAPREVVPFGLVAEVGRGEPVFLLRADMDALPVAEESGLPFAAQGGACAHVCGHDLHMAILLGAAKLLKERESELTGTVRLLFQPNEEGMTGAADMIAAGVLENPSVAAVFGLHVMPGLPVGAVAAGSGPVMAAQDRFKLTITGKGGHGARPEQTIDPINAGVHIHLAWQSLLAREVAGTDTAVVTVGAFYSGGAPNVIPETAVLEGTVRTFQPETRAFLKARMAELAGQTASAFRASCVLDFYGEIPAVANDGALTGELSAALAKAGLSVIPQQPLMVSEDFSFFSNAVPGAFFFLGTGENAEGRPLFGLHHPKVWFDEAALPAGAAALAEGAMAWLNGRA